MWRVDFAWPEQRLVAEYDSVAWHSGAAKMLDDRIRTAAIQDLGYTVVPIVAPDIFADQWSLVARLRSHLERAA